MSKKIEEGDRLLDLNRNEAVTVIRSAATKWFGELSPALYLVRGEDGHQYVLSEDDAMPIVTAITDSAI